MFDANMRHLPKGRNFFARVYYCDENTKLFQLGVTKNQILYCKMLTKGHKDVVVRFQIGGINYDLTEDEDDWIVYEGNEDLTSFISKESLGIASELLEDVKSLED